MICAVLQYGINSGCGVLSISLKLCTLTTGECRMDVLGMLFVLTLCVLVLSASFLYLSFLHSLIVWYGFFAISSSNKFRSN